MYYHGVGSVDARAAWTHLHSALLGHEWLPGIGRLALLYCRATNAVCLPNVRPCPLLNYGTGGARSQWVFRHFSGAECRQTDEPVGELSTDSRAARAAARSAASEARHASAMLRWSSLVKSDHTSEVSWSGVTKTVIGVLFIVIVWQMMDG